MRYRVIVISGGGAGRRFELASDQARVGRATDCEVTLDQGDDTVSQHHGLLAVRDGRLVFEDTSTNGTFVGEQRVRTQLVDTGTTLQLGRTGPQIRFEILDVPRAARTRVERAGSWGGLPRAAGAQGFAFGPTISWPSAAVAPPPVMPIGESYASPLPPGPPHAALAQWLGKLTGAKATLAKAAAAATALFAASTFAWHEYQESEPRRFCEQPYLRWDSPSSPEGLQQQIDNCIDDVMGRKAVSERQSDCWMRCMNSKARYILGDGPGPRFKRSRLESVRYSCDTKCPHDMR